MPAISKQIHLACLRRGWNPGELSQRSGVSRTTLYHLLTGRTARPRASTLQKIAKALDLSPEDLADNDVDSSADTITGSVPAGDVIADDIVENVRTSVPGLFLGWKEQDWQQLRATLASCGPLNTRAVRETAERINASRETLRQLQVVMETHLRSVAIELVETLYRMARPTSNGS